MKLLLALLPIMFMLCIGLTVRFFSWYCFFGEDGLRIVRMRVEEPGDYRRIRRFLSALGAFHLFFSLAPLVLGLFTFLYFLALDGKKGVGMDTIRQYGLWILLGAAALIFLGATPIRLYTRRLMKADPLRTDPPADTQPPQTDEYRVCNVQNPERIDRLVNGIMFFLMLGVIAVFMLLSPYISRVVSVPACLAALAGLVHCVRAFVRERRQILTLLVISRSGILDDVPGGIHAGLIPWSNIADYRFTDEYLELELLSSGTDASTGDPLRIPLKPSTVSPDTIRVKVRQYLNAYRNSRLR